MQAAPPSSLGVVGEFVLTTKQGDLIGQKIGVFDIVTGEVIAFYTIQSGAWVGTLFATGFVDPATGFGDDVRMWGRVCRAE